jgi:hypothetical protein
MTADLPLEREVDLLPCPFCGSKARTSSRLDESLWSHEQVEWLQIGCSADCDIFMASEVHEDVRANWNRRIAKARSPASLEVGREAIARIIDPDAWAKFERKARIYAAHVTEDERRVWDNYMVAKSLAKADEIIGLGKEGCSAGAESARTWTLPVLTEAPRPAGLCPYEALQELLDLLEEARPGAEAVETARAVLRARV